MEASAEVRLIEKLIKKDPQFEFKNWELGKKIDTGEQRIHSFPSTLTLAHFSNLSYSPIEEVNEFLSSPSRKQLFENWELLAVCNGRYAYRGMALISNQLQQIVLVHRGTVKTSLGNIFSDYRILFQDKTGYQLQEASTFADEVGKVALKLGFQLIITGHSMGGVLAQVTAATVKFLKLNGNEFLLKSEGEFDEIHPHVETFESPGSFDVIRTMLKTNPANVGLERAVTYLDVTNLIMGPNIVNTIGTHFGTLICVDKSLKLKKPLIKGADKHSISVFIDLFESKQEVCLQIFNWAHTTSTAGLMRKVAGGIWKYDASRTTAFADFHFRMWPDYCFTQKEMTALQLINFAAKIGVVCSAVEKIPRFHIHGTHFKMVKFPPEISAEQRDSFVLLVRNFARNEDFEKEMEERIEKESQLSMKLLSELSANFNNPVISELYLNSLSLVKKSRGKLKEIIELNNASDLDKKLLAVLIRNTWMNKRPHSMGIVFPDKATFERMFVHNEHFKNNFLSVGQLLLIVVVKSYEDNVVSIVDIVKLKYGKNFHFVFIQNNSNTYASDLDEEEMMINFHFKDLSEHSQNELQESYIGLQKEKYKIKLKELAPFLSLMNLFELVKKLEQGYFLPQTWQTPASALVNNFYIHSAPLSHSGTPFDLSLGIKTNILRIIAANPGMGKTACLANFRHQMKQLRKDIFVFMISLRKLNRDLDDREKIAGKEIEIIQAYLEMDEFDATLLNYAMSLQWRVIFLFDGFDEVSNNSRRNCQMLINYFVTHKAVMQVWVTSRKDALRVIESDNILMNFERYDLGLFSRQQQRLYLEQLLAAKKEETSGEIIAKYMDRLKLVSRGLGADTLGVPLTLRLLVEMGAHNTETRLLKPYQLIDKFMHMKFAIYYFDKVGLDNRTVSNSDLTEIRLSFNFNLLTFYALRQVYVGVESICKPLPELESQIKDRHELIRIKNLGFLDGSNEFFHRTVAEFLIANSVKIALGFYQHEWQSSNLQEWLANSLCKFPSNVHPFQAYLVKLLAAKMTNVTWIYLNDMVQCEEKPRKNSNIALLELFENNCTARFEMQNCILEHNSRSLFDFLVEKTDIFRTTRHSISHRPFISSEVPILMEAIARNKQNFAKHLLESNTYLQEACEFCEKQNRYFIFHDIAKYNFAEAFAAFWQKMPNLHALNSAEYSNICTPSSENDLDYTFAVPAATNGRNILSRMYLFTPLHIAVLLRHEQMVKMLLAAGAAVHPENVKVSPLLAFISTFFEPANALKEGKVGILQDVDRRILKMLLDYGALKSIQHLEQRKREFIRKLDDELLGDVFLELMKEDKYHEIGWGEYFSYFLDEETEQVDGTKKRLSHCKILSATLPAAIRSVHLMDCEDVPCILRSNEATVSDKMHIREIIRRAVEKGNEKCTELFLRHNSLDLFFVDEQFNLLSIALAKGHTHIFKMILSKYPKLLDASNKYGQKPVHLAAKYLNKEAVVFLLDNLNQDLYAVTTYGRTLVHVVVVAACKTEQMDILELLKFLVVEREMDVFTRDYFGKTPLHLACKFSPKFSVIELLIFKGADVNAKCNVGNTPLHILAEEGPDKYLHIYCAAILKKSGASVGEYNDLLETPLDIARRGNKTGIVEILKRNCDQLDASSVCGLELQTISRNQFLRFYIWTKSKIVQRYLP